MDYLKTKRMLRLFRNCPPNKPLNQPAAEEMQLIRRLRRHLPFQGKVKGILPRLGRRVLAAAPPLPPSSVLIE